MFLANRKLNNQVKTYITYNRGRDWRLLQAPSQDLKGNSIHCLLASVSQNAAFTLFFFVLYMCVRPSKLSLENANDPRSRGNNVCQSALRRLLWKVSQCDVVQQANFSFVKVERERNNCQTAQSSFCSFLLKWPWQSSPLWEKLLDGCTNRRLGN